MCKQKVTIFVIVVSVIIEALLKREGMMKRKKGWEVLLELRELAYHRFKADEEAFCRSTEMKRSMIQESANSSEWLEIRMFVGIERLER